jgi:transmembrane sensor
MDGNMAMNERVEQEALDWVIRLAEPDFADWAGLDAWLAADPAHGQAYWPMAEGDRKVLAALTAMPAATVSDMATHRARRWRPIVGWAVAATLVAMVGGYALRAPTTADLVVASKPGMPRALDLPDGSHVALNGDTRIVVDGRDPRKVRLDHGEASFEVRHDADHPFTLGVGSAVISDLGTRFDVVRDGGETRIAVAEGAVRYERDDRTQTLGAGQTLRAADGSAAIALGRVDPAFVSGWRTHRLVYDRTPVTMVAADLARSTGLVVSVAPGLRGSAFTGTISTDGAGDEVVTRFATMMDVRATRQADGWVLTRR